MIGVLKPAGMYCFGDGKRRFLQECNTLFGPHLPEVAGWGGRQHGAERSSQMLGADAAHLRYFRDANGAGVILVHNVLRFFDNGFDMRLCVCFDSARSQPCWSLFERRCSFWIWILSLEPWSNLDGYSKLCTMKTAIKASINTPEFEHYPEAFSSWIGENAPKGYFNAPIGTEEVRFYKENGFLVLQNGLSSEELETLKTEAVRICREEGEQLGNEYVDGESEDDAMRRFLCIHFPHKISEIMREYLRKPQIADVLTNIISPNVKCMQSMLFIKASGKPGQAWHQDEFFIPTRDRSLTGGWIAMDDATVQNGCLWVIPGSHKRGILWPQRKHEDRRFDCAALIRGNCQANPRHTRLASDSG